MKYLAPAITALLVLTACGGGGSDDTENGATEELQTDMVATMVRHGLDDETAACVADDLAGRLTPSMYAEVTAAETAADIPVAWQAAVVGANNACTGTESAEVPAADDVATADSDEPAVVADDDEPDAPVAPDRETPGDADG